METPYFPTCSTTTYPRQNGSARAHFVERVFPCLDAETVLSKESRLPPHHHHPRVARLKKDKQALSHNSEFLTVAGVLLNIQGLGIFPFPPLTDFRDFGFYLWLRPRTFSTSTPKPQITDLLVTIRRGRFIRPQWRIGGMECCLSLRLSVVHLSSLGPTTHT